MTIWPILQSMNDALNTIVNNRPKMDTKCNHQICRSKHVARPAVCSYSAVCRVFPHAVVRVYCNFYHSLFYCRLQHCSLVLRLLFFFFCNFFCFVSFLSFSAHGIHCYEIKTEIGFERPTDVVDYAVGLETNRLRIKQI